MFPIGHNNGNNVYCSTIVDAISFVSRVAHNIYVLREIALSHITLKCRHNIEVPIFFSSILIPLLPV